MPTFQPIIMQLLKLSIHFEPTLMPQLYSILDTSLSCMKFCKTMDKLYHLGGICKLSKHQHLCSYFHHRIWRRKKVWYLSFRHQLFPIEVAHYLDRWYQFRNLCFQIVIEYHFHNYKQLFKSDCRHPINLPLELQWGLNTKFVLVLFHNRSWLIDM